MSEENSQKADAQKENEQVIEDQISNEEFEKISKMKYLGLSNQGATCYMNSLLQSLFMTYEFRQKLYSWQYSQKKHNKEEDCLPLQLQILFSRLQTSTNRSFIDTKPLIHTFGWTNSQMFQQQDVQEFCRVLFDAIEQSFDHQKESEWIRDLYEGLTENFVFCQKCQTDSIRNDKFLDLQLIIRNDFDNIMNNSLEKCLKHFVQSVKLDGVNQYFCEKCNEKSNYLSFNDLFFQIYFQQVDAIKGVRFKALPPILMLQLNRFDLDYETFQRKKICDRVYFPNVLNMNEFLKKYEDIQIEEPPKPKETEYKGYEVSTTRSKVLSKRKASFDEGQGQDCKPLFDDEVPVKKFGSEQGDNEDQKIGNQFLDSLQQKDMKSQEPLKKKQTQKNPALFMRADEAYEYEENQFNQVNDFALFADIPGKPDRSEGKQKIIEQQKQEGYTKKNVKIQKSSANTNADEAYDIDNNGIQGNDNENCDDIGISWSTTVPKKDNQDDMLSKFREANQKRDTERNKEIIKENMEQNNQNHDLINKYLQDGPYVYELYAVNVHSGGALGGHYFSYIKSFENGLWYNFNDSSVSKIRPSALETVYGQENPKGNQNTSAYMVMYRQVSLDEQKNISSPDVPEQIVKQLKEEEEQEKKRIEEQQRLQQQRNQQIDFRIYINQEEQKLMTFNKFNQCLNDIKIAVMEKFEIKEDLSNWRIRAYSNYEKLMQDTFTGKENLPIVELEISDSKDLIVEFKKPEQQFEEYDPTKINVNIHVWDQSVGLIENFGSKLIPTLKQINNQNYKNIIDILILQTIDQRNRYFEAFNRYFSIQIKYTKRRYNVKQKFISNIQFTMNKIYQINRLLKKSNRSSNFKIMFLNDRESTLDNTLKQLDIYNNIEIYVEKKSDSIEVVQEKEKRFAWEVQIEKESYSCTIQFNNPRDGVKKGYSENKLEITIDNRCTLRDAKNLIAKKINMDANKFIMKKNVLHNCEELKDLSIKLHNLQMIHRGNLFLSEGIPQTIDQFSIEFRILSKFENSSLTINIDSEHFANLLLKTSMTVYEVKEVLVQKLKEEKNIDVKSPKCLRLQERLQEYKVILRNEKTLGEYQLHDRKVFGITILNNEEDIKNDEILIFTKFWNWKTKELQNTVELVMKSNYDCKDFMQMVATYYDMPPEDIEVYYIQSKKNQSLESISYQISGWQTFDNDFEITLNPWFLSRDAETFIVRDRNLFSENKQEILNYLKGITTDEMLPQNQGRYKDPNGQADVKGKLQYKPTETALKINLKKKVVENEEAKESEETEVNEETKETEEGQQEGDKNNKQNVDLQKQNENTQAVNTDDKQQEKVNNNVIVKETDNKNKDSNQLEQNNNENIDTYPPSNISSYPPSNISSYPPSNTSYPPSNTSYPPKQKEVRFDEVYNQDFEDEDAIMQQILLASLQDYSNQKQN